MFLAGPYRVLVSTYGPNGYSLDNFRLAPLDSSHGIYGMLCEKGKVPGVLFSFWSQMFGRKREIGIFYTLLTSLSMVVCKCLFLEINSLIIRLEKHMPENRIDANQKV